MAKITLPFDRDGMTTRAPIRVHSNGCRFAMSATGRAASTSHDELFNSRLHSHAVVRAKPLATYVSNITHKPYIG